MSAYVLTACVIGIEAHPVHVEADISLGLPHFSLVGLPDIAVQESKERVRSALKHAEIDFPRTRITVNLAPADLKKVGTPFDLPIALAILMAQGSVPAPAAVTQMFAGELGLDGRLRPIRGALSLALLARARGLKELILPADNAREAALIDGLEIRPASCLRDVIHHLLGSEALPSQPFQPFCSDDDPVFRHDFSAIRGQEQARRVLEIAAGGGHNVLMQGPPGSGKTLLARTFPSILPHLSAPEAIEITRLHSVAGLLKSDGVCRVRPFRSPHHSASIPSLVGGGSIPHPGEISLAHRGVLFLDEFLEFSRTTLENLRQPLEDGHVTISRAHGTLHFPARFILIAATNPCPCGHFTDAEQACACSPQQIQKYRKRLSGPLLDRIDLLIEVPKVKTQQLTDLAQAETSADIRARVQAARIQQASRYAGLDLTTNAELNSDQVRRLIRLDEAATLLAKQAVDRFRLSARAYFRVLKIAQTIADLAHTDPVTSLHVAEALQYRQLTP